MCSNHFHDHMCVTNALRHADCFYKYFRLAQEQCVGWLFIAEQLYTSLSSLSSIQSLGWNHWTLELWRHVLWSNESLSCLAIWWTSPPVHKARAIKTWVWCGRTRLACRANIKPYGLRTGVYSNSCVWRQISEYFQQYSVYLDAPTAALH